MEKINQELTEQMAGLTCRHCGGGPIEVQNRFEPSKTFSLAGVQLKYSGRFWPWAVCTNCGHQSRGEVD